MTFHVPNEDALQAANTRIAALEKQLADAIESKVCAWKTTGASDKAYQEQHALAAALMKQLARDWHGANNSKPEGGVPVLVAFHAGSQERWARAMWVPEKSINTDVKPFDEGAEYDEADDAYYWPQGWYEWNHVEDTHWKLDDGDRIITYWAYVKTPNVKVTGAEPVGEASSDQRERG